MTEGEKAINIKLSLSLLPSRLWRATFLVRGRLYFHIIVNLIAPESSSVFVNSYGGSKPLPYTVGYNFSLRAKYQLLRIADTRKGCPYSALLTPHSLLRTPHSATVLPPFHRAGLLFERRTELDVAAAFHTDARNQMLTGFANFNA